MNRSPLPWKFDVRCSIFDVRCFPAKIRRGGNSLATCNPESFLENGMLCPVCMLGAAMIERHDGALNYP
jgi:hypothetical protein